jgi:hypothetical protein
MYYLAHFRRLEYFSPIDLTSEQSEPFAIHTCQKPGRGKVMLTQKTHPKLLPFSILAVKI